MNKFDKKSNINIAIGLQKVDGLNNSKYFLNLTNDYLDGKITSKDLQKLIFEYYEYKKQYPEAEKQADVVANNINISLASSGFSLSIATLLNIHKMLFNHLLLDAGKYRTKDFKKKEWVLNGDSVLYSSYSDIEPTLLYEFDIEKKFDYSKLSVEQKIEHLADFISSIWQIHPFSEGNTRTIAVFLIKYLRYLGYDASNQPFEKDSWYFRNALVRSNYHKHSLEIYENKNHLIKFLKNMILKTNYPLRNRDLHIYANFNNNALSINEKIIIEEILINPSITSNKLIKKLNVSTRTLRTLISGLKKKNIIKRINGNKKGFWDITIKDRKG